MEGKITQLTERGTGTPMWPQTLAEGVLMEDGRTLGQMLPPELSAAARCLFADMWDSAFLTRSGYNGAQEKRGYCDRETWEFVAYDLRLTYKEALEVWKASEGSLHTQKPSTCRFSQMRGIRTLLPITDHWGGGATESHYAMFDRSPDLEVICFPFGIRASNQQNMFHGCTRLRRIIGVIENPGGASYSGMFTGCAALEEVSVQYLLADISFADSPKLSINSLNFMIEHRSHMIDASKVLTVTVHPDVFARLTDADNAEWSAVLAKAAEKNITFATL